jgi:hypothetical protein
MHYDMHDSGGTPLLLLHGGLSGIRQQFGELLAGHSPEPSRSRCQPAASPLPAVKNQTFMAISPNTLGQWGTSASQRAVSRQRTKPATWTINGHKSGETMAANLEITGRTPAFFRGRQHYTSQASFPEITIARRSPSV